MNLAKEWGIFSAASSNVVFTWLAMWECWNVLLLLLIFSLQAREDAATVAATARFLRHESEYPGLEYPDKEFIKVKVR